MSQRRRERSCQKCRIKEDRGTADTVDSAKRAFVKGDFTIKMKSPDRLEVIFGSMSTSIYRYDSKFHPKTDRLL